MRWTFGAFFLFLLSLLTSGPLAQGQGGTKKKVIYKSYTQLDFSGETVQGKIRAPEVFYIFQRKRSEGHRITRSPAAFNHHRELTFNILKAWIPREKLK